MRSDLYPYLLIRHTSFHPRGTHSINDDDRRQDRPCGIGCWSRRRRRMTMMTDTATATGPMTDTVASTRSRKKCTMAKNLILPMMVVWMVVLLTIARVPPVTSFGTAKAATSPRGSRHRGGRGGTGITGTAGPGVSRHHSGGFLQQQIHPLSSSSSPTSLHHGLRKRQPLHNAQSSPSSSCTSLSYSASSASSSVASVLVSRFRGGAAATGGSAILGTVRKCYETPTALFNTSLLAVALLTVVFKVLQQQTSFNDKPNGATATMSAPERPTSVRDLQRKFLAVFWLLRCADWLQGPYFYQVYASKVFRDGTTASMALVSRLFLTGFASTALFGPLVGRAVDQRGRKKGTLAFAFLYALGAISTQSTWLWALFLGRICSGIGTSLLFSAPESWLVAESQKTGDDPDGKYLGETFGMAYSGDSVVAILAGQLAGLAAANRGPTGPFELSTGFLMLGGLMAAFLWNENVAPKDDSSASGKPSIKEALQVVRDDPKIMMVGGVQSLFEAAMYIFVLQWPPAMARAVVKAFGEGAATPYGTVFSCFMACCLFGSTLFGQFAKMSGPTTEIVTAGMLAVATVAMTTATATVSSTLGLPALIASFFAFEACVGMYFPSIGTLRSKYVPDSHRSVIMNLFGIPLNVLVVGVFLSISKLGLSGALGISSGALALATFCMVKLNMTLGAKAKADSSLSPTPSPSPSLEGQGPASA